ncbi:MAG: alpha/beta hydrolase [Ancalomicrobiaceae bacterium]|nr:alpha/beta hydrolase [Ancalomicrobiaceae bacterium]
MARRAMLACVLSLMLSQPAEAAGVTVKGVTVGGVAATLLLPAKPHGAIILLAGGDGNIGVGPDGAIARPGNQLVRTREAYAARGFAVLVPEGSVNVPEAVTFMRSYGKVTLVGTSRGTQRAARGIAAGARPDRLVLTSGFLSDASGDTDNVEHILGSANLLPPTLIVHNKNDQCLKTQPAGVAPFLAWAGGRARVTWLAGGTSIGNPCEARAYHGFNGIDGQVVSAVVGFAAR